jgi:hypothetical protein
LVLSGNNGVPGRTYYVLTSTNVVRPLSDWTRVATNSFDPNGNFGLTNAMTPSIGQQFYLLQLP